MHVLDKEIFKNNLTELMELMDPDKGSVSKEIEV